MTRSTFNKLDRATQDQAIANAFAALNALPDRSEAEVSEATPNRSEAEVWSEATLSRKEESELLWNGTTKVTRTIEYSDGTFQIDVAVHPAPAPEPELGDLDFLMEPTTEATPSELPDVWAATYPIREYALRYPMWVQTVIYYLVMWVSAQMGNATDDENFSDAMSATLGHLEATVIWFWYNQSNRVQTHIAEAHRALSLKVQNKDAYIRATLAQRYGL